MCSQTHTERVGKIVGTSVINGLRFDTPATRKLLRCMVFAVTSYCNTCTDRPIL